MSIFILTFALSYTAPIGMPHIFNIYTLCIQEKKNSRLSAVCWMCSTSCARNALGTASSPNTIEETFELCDALLKDDEPNICKELGDVLLHVCFYAKIGQEKEQFDMADVCNKLVDKLIFRHPHVYHPSQVGAPDPKPLPYGEKEEERDNSEEVKTAQQVIENWEQIKLREKDGNKRVLSGVPDALPALIKAYRIQDKARNVGFDWEDKGDREHSTEEFGDFLFSLINAARLYKINPDTALEKTNAKFIRRFNYIEEHSIRIGKPLKDMTLGEMDALWNEAKAQEKK